MTGGRPAGWDEIFASVRAPLGEIAEALDDLISQAAPNAVTAAYPGYRSMSYGIGPRKNTEGCVYIAAQPRWVNLGFYRGTSLTDPKALLEGTGTALRHVKIAAPAFDPAPLAALVAAAFAERHAALETAR